MREYSNYFFYHLKYLVTNRVLSYHLAKVHLFYLHHLFLLLFLLSFYEIQLVSYEEFFSFLLLILLLKDVLFLPLLQFFEIFYLRDFLLANQEFLLFLSFLFLLE